MPYKNILDKWAWNRDKQRMDSLHRKYAADRQRRYREKLKKNVQSTGLVPNSEQRCSHENKEDF